MWTTKMHWAYESANKHMAAISAHLLNAAALSCCRLAAASYGSCLCIQSNNSQSTRVPSSLALCRQIRGSTTCPFCTQHSSGRLWTSSFVSTCLVLYCNNRLLIIQLIHWKRNGLFPRYWGNDKQWLASWILPPYYWQINDDQNSKNIAFTSLNLQSGKAASLIIT